MQCNTIQYNNIPDPRGGGVRGLSFSKKSSGCALGGEFLAARILFAFGKSVRCEPEVYCFFPRIFILFAREDMMMIELGRGGKDKEWKASLKYGWYLKTPWCLCGNMHAMVENDMNEWSGSGERGNRQFLSCRLFIIKSSLCPSKSCSSMKLWLS